MSIIDSIVFSQVKQLLWCKLDMMWMLGLFGIVIGVGVLFFFICVGFGGFIFILLMLVLVYFIVFYCYWVLVCLCLFGFNLFGNIMEMVEEYFGKMGGVVIMFFYFFVICLLLWIYGVIIINMFMIFWENQLQMLVLNCGFVVLFLLLLMVFVIWFGKDLMVKVMSYLVWLFIVSLVLILLLLIFYWNLVVIDQVDFSNIVLIGYDGILVMVWLGIFIMVFFFNFLFIVFFFVVFKWEEYEKEFGCEFIECKCLQIILCVSMLMVVVVMFFVFSCLFMFFLQNMVDVKVQNILVFFYLVNYFVFLLGIKFIFVMVLEYGVFIIVLVVIFKFFFGYYLGMLEGLNGLVLKFGYKGDKIKVFMGKFNIISMIFIMGFIWVVVYVNLNILDLIEVMGVLIIVLLLCLLLMYVICKVLLLVKYCGCLDNVFVILIGLLIILNIVYKLF